MNFVDYQDFAARTSSFHEDNKGEDRLKMSLLGLFGEVGELANKAKKVMWHGHDYDPGEFVEELGDCLWYLSEIATTLDFDLETIAQTNIDKLKARYPDGFLEKDSRERKG